MAVTAETLARHELVGLPVEVVGANNEDVVGVAGTVVGETTNTLAIEADDERVWHVPKEGASFTFDLGAVPDVESDDRVRIEGQRLVARPARRTETSGDSPWR